MEKLLRRYLVFIASVLTISAQAQNPQSDNGTNKTAAPDWENPAVLGINKLPYHTTLQLPSKWKECKEIVSLDGEWQFHWGRNPEEGLCWCDGSYLEDQDMWRLSGIFREVQLWVRPLVHIVDYQVTAVPDRNFTKAKVTADIAICNTAG